MAHWAGSRAGRAQRGTQSAVVEHSGATTGVRRLEVGDLHEYSQESIRRFTFAWYRIIVELPQQVDGVPLVDSRVFFETNVDNYGEIWVDGKIDRQAGV